MIGCTTFTADLTARRPFDEFFIGNGNINDTIKLDSQIAENRIEGDSLTGCTGESVENKAFLAVILGKTFFDDAYCNSIGNELSVIHVLLCFQAERSLFLYSCTEHVARGDLRNTILVNQAFGLCAFAGPGRAH